MLKNYITSAINNLLHNKLFSAINIIGLSIALVGVIFISLYVRDELAYDKWVPEGDSVVRLHTSFKVQPYLQSVRSAGRMMEVIRDNNPTIVDAGVRLVSANLNLKLKENTFAEQVTFADGSFFDIFSLRFIEGSTQSSFSKPMDLVISKSMAAKYFGRTNVIGETLSLCCVDGIAHDLRISGVIEDIPRQSHFDINFLIRFQPSLFDFDDSVLNTWTSLNLYTYFKVRDPSLVTEFQSSIDRWLADKNSAVAKSLQNELPPGTSFQDIVELNLMPISDIHLHAKAAAGTLGDFKPLGDIRTVMTIIAAAVLLLFIALFNYVNLTTAHASHRAREVSLRKVMGAQRIQLSSQFLGESVTITFVALFVALVLVEILMPTFNLLMGFSYELNFAKDGPFLLAIMCTVVLIGLLAGTYPAFYMSKFRPATTLKAGRSQSGDGQEKLRSLLVVFQFIVFVILGISTLVIFAQIYYVRQFDVGYQYDNKLVLYRIDSNDVRGKLPTLVQEVTSLPAVESVVFSNDVPSQDNENSIGIRLIGTTNSQAVDKVLAYYSVSAGYFEAYGMELLAGRAFRPDGGSDSTNGQSAPSAIINERALKEYGFVTAEEAIGRTLMIEGLSEFEIIGVARDVYYRSLKFDVKPSVFFNSAMLYRVATINFNPSTKNTAELIKEIEAIWTTITPQTPFNVRLLSNMISTQYESEDQQVTLLSIFSSLSILVACLGLYGLSSFTIERKRREIALRKLHGGRIRHILSLLIKNFSMPVLVANLLGWPLAIWSTMSWLENFTHRLDIGWLLIISLAITITSFLLMWSTIITNTYKSIRQRPVEALRYE